MATNIPVFLFRIKCRITSKWKQLVTQPNGSVGPHNGMDYGSVDLRKTGKKENEDILAMYDGECTAVTDLGELGWACKVYYPTINETWYYVHVKEVLIKKDQKVKAGQVIAHVGVAKKQNIKKCPEHTHVQSRKGRETGNVYVIRMDGNSINPNVQIAKSKLLSELNAPKPPVVVEPVKPPITPPVEQPTVPVTPDPIDWKQKYEQSVTDHGDYVVKQNQKYNDLDKAHKKNLGYLNEVIEALHYNGPVDQLRFHAEVVYKNYELYTARQKAWENILKKIVEVLKRFKLIKKDK